jgi:sugar-specific transcriptional regulator TrmB
MGLAVQEGTAQTLSRLGLTVSQIKVYLALLRLEKATAKTISKHSEVPRQEVYRILAELREKGLVEEILSTPNEFRPVSITEGASILLQRRKSEVAKLQSETRKLVETEAGLSKEAEKFLEKEYQCIMIPAKETLNLRVAETFARTHASIDVLSTVKRLAVTLEEYGYDDAVKRGVEVRVISEEPEGRQFFERNVPSLFGGSNFELRYMPHSPDTAFACFDGREVYITTNVKARADEAPLLWSNNPSIVGLVLDCFELEWNNALKSRPKKRHISQKKQA